MRIHLKAGDKLFINGAVLSVDQKTSINVLNDVRFLLGSHVLQPDKTDTPLKQLYFVIQSALIEPSSESLSLEHYLRLISRIRKAVSNQDIHSGLDRVETLVDAKKYFDALKVLRGLFSVEKAVLEGEDHLVDPLVGNPDQDKAA
ncbi:flagellar biosynthesis repressor FlbT [Flexibacterium corallicola]|uniref:flagellar biosynthesis repressor FlbT n=1 Tax=Flexibacterium corallicola TaxID=3037259 RepID=UPI00286FAE7B|nr:flagellar biosynthesis repressor FlbT [Pseudovibrio sp. M1P-2-3]